MKDRTGEIMMLTKKALLVVLFAGVSHLPTSIQPATGSFLGHGLGQNRFRSYRGDVKATAQATGITRDSENRRHWALPRPPARRRDLHRPRRISQGFQTTEQKDLRLQVDEHREVNFTLAPASVSHRRSQRDRSSGANLEPNPGSGHHLAASGRAAAERTRLSSNWRR